MIFKSIINFSKGGKAGWKRNLYEKVGLTSEEYQRILDILGREPNELELNMYGVMWSEHCSYEIPESRFLKCFPTLRRK